jgi:hypothetical protein
MADNQVDLKLNLDFKGVNDALYQMIGEFNGTDKEFQKIADNIQKNANKLEAAILVFGPASKQAAAAQKALQNNMLSLVANGVNPEIAAIGTLSQNFNSLNGIIEKTQVVTNKTTATLDSHASSLKQNNQKYTAFALILQDLPYGFRAIQNNLPALIGSFAGVGGAAYLAFSAIIAGFTFYDEALRKSASAAKKLKEEQTSLNDEIIDSKQNALQQGYLLNQYIEIAKNATLSEKTRNEALKQANIIYGEHNEKLTLANINTKAVKESLDGYIQSLIQMAVAQKYSDQIANNIIENDKIKAKLDDKNIIKSKLLAEVRGKQTNESRDLLDVYEDLRRVNKEIYEIELEQGKNVTQLTNLTNKYSDSLLKATQLSAQFGKTEEKKGGKSPEQILADKLKAIDNANKAEIKAYTDTIDERDKKEFEAGLKLAENLATMRAAGYTDSITYYNAYRAEMDRIANFYNDKEIEEARKKSEKIAKDAEIYDNRQLQNSLDSLKIQSEVATKIANLSSKTNNADRVKILEEYKAALYDLASTGGYTAEQFDKIDDAIKRADAAIAGSQEVVKEYEVTWATTVNDINKMVIDLVNNSIFYLAESLGKALAGEKVDVLSGLGLILADSLMQLGKALIAYAALAGLAIESLKNPLKWKLALGAGIAAIAAGAFLKSKLSSKPKEFANGGIISGPTMGLMGEYPGASHNPEVVAPLDKLKSLMGGGGGTLEARISGNDLLILMNKAGRNNNNTF